MHGDVLHYKWCIIFLSIPARYIQATRNMDYLNMRESRISFWGSL